VKNIEATVEALKTMAFGALSLLTLCVFRMVPIPVSYFTNHPAGHRVGSVRLQVRSSLLTKLDALSRSKQSSKNRRTSFDGPNFRWSWFTCTAPFVGTLLVMAAQGKWIYPIIEMLAFSTVFALPFFARSSSPFGIDL